ncbi:MAG: hypothetical protein HQL87_00665 [Magnetococcales bacterium]|nr:hypothetical protein [Magnetococcales bacterium]
MERVLIPLNWACGTLLLIVALAYPMLDGKFFTGGKKLVAQERVERIAQWETNYYQTHNQDQYLLFSAEEMPEAIRDELGLRTKDDFVYDVFLDNGQLVIRAQASPDSIRSGSLPPLIYTVRKGANDAPSQGSWAPLSGQSPGLF